MRITINSENAEQIGRPIIESIIDAHANSDYHRLVELIPSMKGNFSQEEFLRAVVALEPLGNIQSIEYLGHFSKVKEHLVLWRAKYEQGEEDIFWHLYLSDLEDQVKAVGLFFDL